MGIGNFFDNFMGGLAFGMLANLSFGGWGGGYSCCSFPMMGGFGYQNNQFNYIFDDSFQNSFPNFNFSSVMTSIWDSTKQSMDEYYKRIQTSSENSSLPLSNCYQTIPQYTMPFSGYYFPDIQSSYLYGYYPAFQVKSGKASEPTKTDAEEKTVTTQSEPAKNDKTEKTVVSKPTDVQVTSGEFASIYQKLGITDERFIKIFEGSILKSEGREYIFDVHAMANSGVQQGTYDTYRVNKNLPKRDVKYMTNEEMCELYYGIFKECGANAIKNDRMALYVFDVAVNSGSSRAKEFYAKSGDNPTQFEAIREKYYRYLAKSDPKTYGGYLDGWLNRIKKVRRFADNNFSAVV